MSLERSPRLGAGFGWLGLSLPAALLVLAGCTSAVGPSLAAPAAPSTAPANGTQEIGAPADQAGPAIPPVPGSDVPGSTGAGSASSGTAVGGGSASGNATTGVATYPFPGYVGSVGVAPDHTIVVVGSGQATLKADGSNRAAAERTAIAAALVDARAQADAAAQAAGVTISGVSSISVSVGESYLGIMPMSGSQEPSAVPGAPAIALPAPTAPMLAVTVTVAYRIA